MSSFPGTAVARALKSKVLLKKRKPNPKVGSTDGCPDPRRKGLLNRWM
jgi:hypothetical protein